jgi:diketogulonate reductase-like aldo/keto reductase
LLAETSALLMCRPSPRSSRSLASIESQRQPELLSQADDNPEGYVTLRGGARMPRVGFGTAGLGDGTGDAVRAALRAGYRLLDSAQAREWYREDLVGGALAASALPRQAVFLTTKIHPRHLGPTVTAGRLDFSLRELHTDYLDLMLLHYPECWGDLCGGVAPEGSWRDGWRALEAMHASGVVRALGVSNFDARQLRELLEWARVPPEVVQAHSDPFSQNRELQAACAAHGIVFQAYSSLGSQWWGQGYHTNPVLTSPVIAAAAAAHAVSPAQVVLRWALDKDQARARPPRCGAHACTAAQCHSVTTLAYACFHAGGDTEDSKPGAHARQPGAGLHAHCGGAGCHRRAGRQTAAKELMQRRNARMDRFVWCTPHDKRHALAGVRRERCRSLVCVSKRGVPSCACVCVSVACRRCSRAPRALAVRLRGRCRVCEAALGRRGGGGALLTGRLRRRHRCRLRSTRLALRLRAA